MDRVVHFRVSRYDVYIGRPSKWGNPFKIGDLHHGKTLTRETAIEAFRDWFFHSANGIALQQHTHELYSKVLGCWCKPRACHGDVIMELVEHEENRR